MRHKDKGLVMVILFDIWPWPLAHDIDIQSQPGLDQGRPLCQNQGQTVQPREHGWTNKRKYTTKCIVSSPHDAAWSIIMLDDKYYLIFTLINTKSNCVVFITRRQLLWLYVVYFTPGASSFYFKWFQRISAGAGLLYIAARFQYARGYSTGGKLTI